jgi:hypothetical protein
LINADLAFGVAFLGGPHRFSSKPPEGGTPNKNWSKMHPLCAAAGLSPLTQPGMIFGLDFTADLLDT